MKKQENIWNNLYKKGLTWKKTNKIDENLANKKILELGVGNGKTLKAIIERNPKKVVAIDISEEAISKAKESIKSDKVSYITQDFLKYKTKNKFEIIVCYYFLNNFKIEEKKEVVRKIISMLDKNGTILFEDFAVGDLREKGKEIEHNTMEKENGLICHFFKVKEIKDLFNGLNIKIEEKTFNPIRKNKNIQRKIIQAVIKNYALART